MPQIDNFLHNTPNNNDWFTNSQRPWLNTPANVDPSAANQASAPAPENPQTPEKDTFVKTEEDKNSLAQPQEVTTAPASENKPSKNQSQQTAPAQDNKPEQLQDKTAAPDKEIAQNPVPEKDVKSAQEELAKMKKNNGLLAKAYDLAKNTTGVGFGSKKLQNAINDFENGKVSQDEIDTKLKQYKQSQYNGVQTAGDVAAAAASVSSFLVADKYLKQFRADEKLNSLPRAIKSIFKKAEETLKEDSKELGKLSTFDKINKYQAKAVQGLRKALKSPTKATLIMLPILAITGGTTKQFVTNFDRIGSKEYSVKKKDYANKDEYKAAKKAARKAKRKQRIKEFATGAASGVLAPVTAIAGGIVGVPAYLAATLVLRYATDKTNDKKLSLNDFAQKFKDNAAVNTAAALAVALPSLKMAHYNHVLGKNLNKVVSKLENKKLLQPDLPSAKTAYQELEDLLLSSNNIKDLLDAEVSIPTDEMITRLTDENIFAVKFLQISRNHYSSIAKALREECPPTRTLEEAQVRINDLWDSDEFKVSKLLGVGTIAETYLAKDKSGKEVCIKILKDGITSEKINRDKEKFIKLITGDTPADKLTKDQQYLIKNVEDLASGILKEVDFKNEMNAANELRKYCKVADVAKPIGVKDGIYIMEKAPGISVKTLSDYYYCKERLDWLRKDQAKEPTVFGAESIRRAEEELKKIKSRSPEFEDFDMTSKQIKRLLENYIDLQTEQFSKMYKNGKIIHADIHPGNIFINLNNLKRGKGKLFTLIDTGNTINLSKEQTKASMKIITYIKKGNVKDLTESVLDGAILPDGLTKEQAAEKVQADLKKYFFDSETKIDGMNIDTFHVLAYNILRKYEITPNNTQLNLNKAQTSAENSFNDLFESFFDNKYGDIEIEELNKMDKIKIGSRLAKDYFPILLKKVFSPVFQETKNLFKMSLKEAWNYFRNPNNFKTNSEEYLTYTIKQRMPFAVNDKRFKDLPPEIMDNL